MSDHKHPVTIKVTHEELAILRKALVALEFHYDACELEARHAKDATREQRFQEMSSDATRLLEKLPTPATEPHHAF